MGRARNDGQRERLRQPHRNHVGSDELPHPHTGIETICSKVDKFLAGDDLDLDFRIGAAKRGNYWFQHDRDNASRYCEPEQAGCFNRELTCRFACRHEFFERRPCAGMESLASLGQSDASRGSDE